MPAKTNREERIKEKFKGSEQNEYLISLLNDVFDIINAKFCKEVTDLNWLPNKKKLEEMLSITGRIEKIYLQSNNTNKKVTPVTAIRGGRTSIENTIAITEDFFAENYSFVWMLSSHPVVTSFLPIMRHVSFLARLNTAIKEVSID
ncbi:hypothetical protein OUZ56_018680 [Daphnia magna]|uniref:Uncharacterized protein n=1 Tax=Daphnia magna TaxID=35525 RepID=A0ABQ9Z9J4_9CRUS|nr:hypothetical protein OUZ56_018680 [Daphnia magna]